MTRASKTVLAAGLLLVVNDACVRAGAIIDQSNTTPVTYFYNTGVDSFRPIGQSFTPTRDALDFVELRIDDAGSDPGGPGANFMLRIRSGSILGAIVGASQTVLVPDGTNTGGGSTSTRFLFDTRVSLVPESFYVIEVLQLGPYVPLNASFGMDGNFGDTYKRGQAILNGQPQTNFDFYFVQGIIVPEPSSLVMLGAGVLPVIALARRRRAA